MKRSFAAGLFFIIAALFLICAVYLSPLPLKVVNETRFLLGTTAEIKIAAGNDAEKGSARRAAKAAFDEIGRIEGLFSVFRADSAISKINRLKAGESLEVTDEVFQLIKRSKEFNAMTGGAFDITVKPLGDLWRSAKAEGKLPPEAAVRDELSKTGSDNVILGGPSGTVKFKKDGMALDLGGIAKGYAADKAVDILKKHGIRNAIVNLGGDMYCMGRRSANRLWKVGIRHPRDRNKTFLEIGLEDMAIDTSGDYEKFFLLDGRRYSHIINPSTGYPVGDGVASATVIAEDSVTADALATALCVSGEKALGMVDSMDKVYAVLVVKDGSVFKVKASDGFRKRYGAVKKEIL